MAIDPGKIDLTHLAARILNQALLDGSAIFWERRAREFEWAAPRPTDFNGSATPGALLARWRRCMNTARDCRDHAQVLRMIAADGDASIDPLIWVVLDELDEVA